MTTTETPSAPGIVEEVFDGHLTGVEVEQEPETAAEPAIDKPWNPEQIRVSTSTFSLRNILDMIDEGSLELAPDFQRGKVWKADQKSRLVESLLLQIPLPAFYFAEDSDGAFRVVDGLQRLSTLHAFVRGDDADSFSLKGMEYLHQDGKRFSELPVQWQRRIYNTQLVVNVIDPTTPNEVMYDIFKRINTGGTPLNAQEIRHCMSRDRSRNVLKRMTTLEEFNLATNLSGHIRMNDREMALRFAAFWMFGVEQYLERPVMDRFLERATEALDDPEIVTDEQIERLVIAFGNAMINARLIFGDHAFRKWGEHADGRNPINRALFESWSIALAPYDTDELKHRKKAIVAAARSHMTQDITYLDSITASTSDRRRVAYRFDVAAKIAEGGQ